MFYVVCGIYVTSPPKGMRSNHDYFDLQPQGHFEVNAVNESVRVNIVSSQSDH
jgi:hypothetical protein